MAISNSFGDFAQPEKFGPIAMDLKQLNRSRDLIASERQGPGMTSRASAESPIKPDINMLTSRLFGFNSSRDEAKESDSEQASNSMADDINKLWSQFRTNDKGTESI